MAKDYTASLNLPKTEFSMRANLAAREPGMLAETEKKDLYRAMLKKREGKPSFVLHDGPPFSNGYIHMGHALNKTLKDFIVRSHAMMGYYTPFVPGWDNHGLPIERAIEESKKKLNKDMSVPEFRKACEDFAEDFILVGHDGPHHLRIAEGKPVLRSLTKYHGKPGQGASVEFKIKEGPITMLGITQTADGKMKFVVGEGESKKGAIPPTGNTNTRAFFAPTTKEFVKKWVMEGPTHHYALGVGHRAGTIAKIAKVLGIECVIVR